MNMKYFLRNILGHPSTNPSIITWKFEEGSSFKISSWPDIFNTWRKHANVDVKIGVFMRIIEHSVQLGSIIPNPRRLNYYKFGKRRGSTESGNDHPRLNREMPAVIPEHVSNGEKRGDPSTGRGLMRNFGRMVLKYSGFPESSVSKIGGNISGQTTPNLEWNQRKPGRPIHEVPLPPPAKRGRPSTRVREDGNPTEVVPRAILPRPPEMVGEHTEYPARVLMPMDRRKKVILMIAGMTINLEPSPFANFPRTNSGQQGRVLAPPRVITVRPEPSRLVSGQVAVDSQNKGVDLEEVRLTGSGSMAGRVSLPDLKESKEVEVTVRNPLTNTGASELKPKLLLAKSGRNERSVSMEPEWYRQLEEMKHEDLEKPLCDPVAMDDQVGSGLITTHFEIKEELIESSIEESRRDGDSPVVQLPKVELSPKTEVFMRDHPRLAGLKDPKGEDLVVPEPIRKKIE